MELQDQKCKQFVKEKILILVGILFPLIKMKCFQNLNFKIKLITFFKLKKKGKLINKNLKKKGKKYLKKIIKLYSKNIIINILKLKEILAYLMKFQMVIL